MSIEETISAISKAWTFFHHNRVVGHQFLIDANGEKPKVSIVLNGDSTKNARITGEGATIQESLEDLMNQCLGFIEEAAARNHKECTDKFNIARGAHKDAERSEEDLRSKLRFLLEHRCGKKIDQLFYSDRACEVSPTKTHVYPAVCPAAGEELKCLFCEE